MKNILYRLGTLARCLIFFPLIIVGVLLTSFEGGCKTPPASRVAAVQTLESVGATAKASVQAAATLLAKGKITVAQWNTVSSIYDTKFQPAYNLAVSAVNADLSSIASPDLVNLASQLATTVEQLIQATP
jgi:hypothetical protein